MQPLLTGFVVAYWTALAADRLLDRIADRLALRVLDELGLEPRLT